MKQFGYYIIASDMTDINTAEKMARKLNDGFEIISAVGTYEAVHYLLQKTVHESQP